MSFRTAKSGYTEIFVRKKQKQTRWFTHEKLHIKLVSGFVYIDIRIYILTYVSENKHMHINILPDVEKIVIL